MSGMGESIKSTAAITGMGIHAAKGISTTSISSKTNALYIHIFWKTFGVSYKIFTIIIQNSIKLLVKNEYDPAKVLYEVNNKSNRLSYDIDELTRDNNRLRSKIADLEYEKRVILQRGVI